MTLIVKDRVIETSTSTGTGAFTLAGAPTGFRTFSSVCSVGDIFYYMIEAVDSSGIPTGPWEAGIGTYSSANTLTRTTVTDSSNAGAAVTFSAGTKRVAITVTAAQLVTPVAVVQSKIFIGDNPTLTLNSTPTVGNMLVAMGAHWQNVANTIPPWTQIVSADGAVTDGQFAAWRPVVSGDTTTIAKPANQAASTGWSWVVFEVSGARFITPVYDSFKELTTASNSLNTASGSDGSALIGFVAAGASSTTPTITGATALTSGTGTATNNSPRILTPFTLTGLRRATGITVTANYGATQSGGEVAVACVLSP